MTFSVDFLYNFQTDMFSGADGQRIMLNEGLEIHTAIVCMCVGEMYCFMLSMIQGYYKNKNKHLEWGLILDCGFTLNFHNMTDVMPDVLDI